MRTLLRRLYLRRSAHVILGSNCGMNFANAICESVFVSNMLLGSVMSLFMRKRKKKCADVCFCAGMYVYPYVDPPCTVFSFGCQLCTCVRCSFLGVVMDASLCECSHAPVVWQLLSSWCIAFNDDTHSVAKCIHALSHRRRLGSWSYRPSPK